MIGRKKKPAQPARRRTPATSTQEHSATERRVRQPLKSGGETGLRSSSFVFRHRLGNVVIFLVLVVAAAQLFGLYPPRASEA